MSLSLSTATKFLGVIALHSFVITALLIGPSKQDWLVFALIYPWAAIGVGVAMHRYFAHRAFRTSRWFQFSLALMASLSFGNAVFFAGKHRLHHVFSDKEGDVHSPQQGFWQCWFGSIIDCGYSKEKIESRCKDYLRYPELALLYRYAFLPPILLNVILFMVGGFTMMAIGGCLSSVLLLHQSSAVNYFCHFSGTRSFSTDDDSRNNVIVALLTFGEGWHNNHHKFASSARAGMKWWEVDMFYYVICLFEVLGLIWNVKRPVQEAADESILLLHASRGK